MVRTDLQVGGVGQFCEGGKLGQGAGRVGQRRGRWEEWVGVARSCYT